MIELPLTFLAGLLGSSHCIGMCGPFALTIGSGATSIRANLVRQLLYSVGRIFTYATLGSIAGYGGQRIGQFAASMVNVPATLAIAAGLLLAYQGLKALGLLPGTSANPASAPCLGGTLLATFLTAPSRWSVFLAGLFTGLLPCGLVYALLALAASSESVVIGLLVMFTFGLGTVPVMVATGCGGSLLGLAARRHLYRLAGAAVLVSGLVSIARGAGFLHLAGWIEPAGCPLCR